MKSYSSLTPSLSGLVRELGHLRRYHSTDIPQRVGDLIEELRSVEARVGEYHGLPLRDLDVLDIGAGQFLIQSVYFSQWNRAVGIDADIVAQGFNPLAYASMLISNGPRRVAKTIGRKLLGIDRRYRTELMRQLGLGSLPKVPVHRMDACQMVFADRTFDFAYSRAVFNVLPDPEAGIKEIVRILRPGGIAYVGLHLYTSETGHLDPRVFRDGQGEIIRWPHLRRPFANQVTPNAYLNKVRLDQWRKLFTSRMPGAEFIYNRGSRPGIKEDALSLLSRGELEGYTLEELLVHDLTVLWRKPECPPP